MKSEFLITNNDSVACVCTPVETDDDITIGGKDVNDFSLALIAPLQSDNAIIHCITNPCS
jgi:hypothetical protein